MFFCLQAQLDEYIRRLEEAERNIRIAEARVAERDQRIVEVERLLDCMGTVRHILTQQTSHLHFLQIINILMKTHVLQEKSQLQKKLQECEQHLRLLELTDTTDATVAKRYKKDVHINRNTRMARQFNSRSTCLLFLWAFKRVYISRWSLGCHGSAAQLNK